jgi:integrase
VKIMLLTGCRKSEAMGARWADIDLAAGTWSRSGDDLKGGEDHTVHLNEPATALIGELRERALKGKRALPEYVFESAASKSKHLVEVHRLWRNVTKAADLKGVRIHDLRHSFASVVVSAGASLPLVGALLGHKSIASTQRYAHLFADAQRAASEAAGAFITSAGKPNPAPEPQQPSAQVLKYRGKTPA